MADECKCEAGAPKWVVTFGDMMSLLLCFFILLLSFSSTDVAKYKEMSGSVKEAMGIIESDMVGIIKIGDKVIGSTVELPRSLVAMVAARAKALRVSKSSSDIDMESGADWVRIKINGDALFDSGDWKVKPEAAELLSQISPIINDFDGVVTIEGHTDGQPPQTTRFEPGSFLGNYELAALRAIAVLDHLVVQDNVDKNKLVPISLAETKPIEYNDTEEGRARNRRVEFEFRTGARNDLSGVEGDVIKPQ